jgi:hypothetical protein
LGHPANLPDLPRPEKAGFPGLWRRRLINCTLRERDLVTVEFALPDKVALSEVLDGILESAAVENIPAELGESALDALAGLTTVEAENCFALSLVEGGNPLEGYEIPAPPGGGSLRSAGAGVALTGAI